MNVSVGDKVSVGAQGTTTQKKIHLLQHPLHPYLKFREIKICSCSVTLSFCDNKDTDKFGSVISLLN